MYPISRVKNQCINIDLYYTVYVSIFRFYVLYWLAVYVAVLEMLARNMKTIVQKTTQKCDTKPSFFTWMIKTCSFIRHHKSIKREMAIFF